MSQAKIREIIKKDIMIHGDNCYCDFCVSGGKIDQAASKINKIVMECVPIAAIPFNSDNDYLVGKKRGYNEARAEFLANWEGK